MLQLKVLYGALCEKGHSSTSYQLLLTILTKGIQAMQHRWKKYVDYNKDYVEKESLIWSYSMRVSWLAYELFS